MSTRRFQFRTVDLLLVTVVVALTIVAAKEGPIDGNANSPILLVALAGFLGAVIGRFVSDAFRFGLVAGLLLGVIGYLLAVFAWSLGIKTADTTLFFFCVCGGGVIGGLIPAAVHRWRLTSFRGRTVVLLVGFSLFAVLAVRLRRVSEQDRLVAELRASGAVVSYSDLNPFPTMFDSRRMQSQTEWLRRLLGMRVIRGVTLRPGFSAADAWSTNPIMPLVQDLGIHADNMNDESLEFLNSGKMLKLDSLRFAGRDFDDASLSRIHPLPSLVVLDLDGTSVTDASVEHIAGFPQLKALSVRQTDITADGVKRLQSKIGRVLSD